MTEEDCATSGAIAFALIYFTFFLDNVLLTVLVPIIPDWIRGESLALWATHDAPLAVVLNSTVNQITEEDTAAGSGGSQAIVGVVLGAKAAAQLATAPLAAAAVCRHGPARVLRAATALLLLAAIVFASCSTRSGKAAALSAGAGRAAQGAGAALAGVAGLALVAAALPTRQRDRAVGALLGAVALGVLVGYPFGGATYALWSRGAPFLIIATALLANLGMQHIFLEKEAFNQPTVCMEGRVSPMSALTLARRECVGACAGAVLLTTSVMAALEPCLPLWIMIKFHPQRWQTGAVFIPDSAGYLVAASSLGGAARRLGAERVALVGQAAVGLAALAVPHATSVGALALPHVVLGCGLGATDAALVPALVARHPNAVPHIAALVQAASSGAYALGPVVGGVLSWCVGFETALRALGVLNLLYAAFLYHALTLHPLSEQWGASTPEEDLESEPGPGPGAYQLPTTVGHNQHDPSRYRNPMFSFGLNAGLRLKPLGPGPAYRIDRVTRDGLVTSPAWSFGASFPTRSTLRTPGPGAHAPERCPPMREPRAPVYSMGARLGFALKRPGPAPNAYALRLGSGSPAYTMGARVGFNPKAKSPGPAVYFQHDTNVYRTKQPIYSLGARLEGAGKATKSPGPANYPPNLYNTKKNPYSYSFGTKHGDYAPPMIIKEDTMDCL